MEHCYRAVRGGDAATALGAILPVGVAAVEALGTVAPDPLFAGEATAVARAIERRQLEFARGRSCARRAMAILGVAPSALPCGPDRAPIWPSGVTGSITHCADYCCAVVAPVAGWSSLGIDAEQVQALEPGVERQILLESERADLLTADPAVAWTSVVFSVKEAFYKAVYARVRRILEFHDVEVRLDPERGRFEARLVVTDTRVPTVVEGRFCIDGPRVLSVVAVR